MNYKKNYLENVIFRIDFPLILEITSNLPIDFQKIITSEFPITEEKTYSKLFDDVKDKETIKYSKSSQWIFSSKDKNRQINLTFDSLSITFNKYSYFPEFFDVTEYIYQNFVKLYNPTLINRLGHRYINNIVIKEGNTFDWKGYINEKLTYTLDNFINEKDKLVRVMNQIVYNYNEYNLIFNFGLINNEFPSLIGRKEFLLDYDCYMQNIEPSNVLPNLKVFNTTINALFENCIDQKLRDLLEIVQKEKNND